MKFILTDKYNLPYRELKKAAKESAIRRGEINEELGMYNQVRVTKITLVEKMYEVEYDGKGYSLYITHVHVSYTGFPHRSDISYY